MLVYQRVGPQQLTIIWYVSFSFQIASMPYEQRNPCRKPKKQIPAFRETGGIHPMEG
jgi:hypothetical protein